MPLAITPTFSPWTHTSDDSYIYQLSLVLATATVSFLAYLGLARSNILGKNKNRKVPMQSFTVRPGVIRYVRLQSVRVCFPKTVGTLPRLCGKIAQFMTLPRYYLLSSNSIVYLALGATSYLILILQSRMFSRIVMQACLGALDAGLVSDITHCFD